MAAPQEIIDGFECILDVFLSNVRHRERVVFILCDNLVELSCKTKAHQRDHTFNRHCGFNAAWNANGVRLAPNGLGRRVQGRRDTRNTMQHGSAAVTVSVDHAADAILDVQRVINKLWPNSLGPAIRLQYRMAVKVVELYSSGNDPMVRQRFEDAMRQARWRGVADDRNARVSEVIVEAGLRPHWGHAVQVSPTTLEQIFIDLESPPPGP